MQIYFLPNEYPLNAKHQFIEIKRVSNLNDYHSPTLGRKYKSMYSLKVDTEIYPVMILTFLINT